MTSPAQPRRLVRSLRAEEGLTIIELMIAVLVLTLGVVALLTSFDASRTLATSSEMHDTGAAIAERELARISSLPWKKVALSTTPTTNQGAGATDPTYYISSGPCGNSQTPSASPCYQWDWNDSTHVEPLVIDSTNGDSTANPQSWSTTVSTNDANVRLSGSIYRYVTWVKDSGCTSSSCGGSNDDKRITVAVTVKRLPKPIWMSTLVRNPVGGWNNPLTQSGTNCVDGGTQVPCTH